MQPRTDPIRRELVFGAVCGLGLSAIVWTLTLWPAATTPANLATLGLACLIGGIAVYPPRAGRLSLQFPASLTLALLLGPGAAVFAAALAAGVAALVPGPEGRLVPERIGHRAGSRALATLAGASALALVASGPLGRFRATELAAFALAYAVVAAGFSWLESWAAGSTHRNLERSAVLRSAAGFALGTASAWAVSAIYADPLLRPWLLVLPMGSIAVLLTAANPAAVSRAPVARRGYESVTCALTKAIASQETAGEERLWRVRDMCVAIGARLGLRDVELQELATGALLHDIGKIAVPEPILTKPGRLSPAEMERVKIHPATGAEILTAIAFPASIASIVRHHHERWDGRGYPDGLGGEEIPLGARILAAVDCYDAIVSNRPYRRALPASEALRHLRHEAGAMFDPEVVDALMDHLDERGQMQRFERISRGQDAVADPHDGADPAIPPISSIPRAQRDLEHLYAVARATRYPVDLDESLTLVATRVAELVPSKCLAVWRLVPDTERLRIVFASGTMGGKLRGLEVPLDDRPVGWTVRHQRAIVAHDHLAPLVSPGSAKRKRARADLDSHLDDPEIGKLSSSVVVPVVHDGKTLGAIALYDDDDRKFTQQEQRLLNGVAGYVARALDRRERHDEPQRTSGMTLTDPLTGLPNARFLWLEAAQRAQATDRGAEGMGAIGAPYGLIAFRVSRLGDVVTRYGTDVADRGLIQIARRLAGTCTALETLVRFGHDLFVVLSPRRPDSDDEPLVERWRCFVDAVECRPLDLPSDSEIRLRLVAAHAAYPLDGDDMDDLFDVLESRLDHGNDDRRTVVPFRRRTATGGETADIADECPGETS